MHCWITFHLFFTHLSVGGHWDYFHSWPLWLVLGRMVGGNQKLCSLPQSPGWAGSGPNQGKEAIPGLSDRPASACWRWKQTHCLCDHCSLLCQPQVRFWVRRCLKLSPPGQPPPINITNLTEGQLWAGSGCWCLGQLRRAFSHGNLVESGTHMLNKKHTSYAFDSLSS